MKAVRALRTLTSINSSAISSNPQNLLTNPAIFHRLCSSQPQHDDPLPPNPQEFSAADQDAVKSKVFGDESVSHFRILQREEEKKKKAGERVNEETEEREVKEEDQKSLSVGIIGAPNAGKSALTNYMQSRTQKLERIAGELLDLNKIERHDYVILLRYKLGYNHYGPAVSAPGLQSPSSGGGNQASHKAVNEYKEAKGMEWSLSSSNLSSDVMDPPKRRATPSEENSRIARIFNLKKFMHHTIESIKAKRAVISVGVISKDSGPPRPLGTCKVTCFKDRWMS